MDAYAPSDRPVLVQWLVDTRNLWPEATQTRQLATVASRALAALLTDEERTAVLKYFHVRDAKMALVSHLLKHLAVARCGRVYWSETRLTRDERTKPVYRDPATGAQPVEFNVSHQAGLVVLAAVYGGDPPPTGGSLFEVGVDVACPGERRARDHQMVAAEGWPRFVDMHADVFAPGEVSYLKYQVLSSMPPDLKLPPSSSAADILDLKLRCFYTLWCLREAYIKMTGEALLAAWLAELEFRQFRPPPLLPPSGPEVATDTDLRQDPTAAVTEHDIRFRGQPVEGVNLRLSALGDDYMVCTAVRSPQKPEAALALEIGALEELRVDDILAFAERFRRPPA